MYVKDMIKGCLLVLEKGESMRPYNVGSGTGVTIGELVQAVVSSSDKNPTIEWDNSKPTTIPYKVSSIERLEKELGFKPDYTFEQGIKETMEWYENL
jgi:GDP-L-fucose synthase